MTSSSSTSSSSTASVQPCSPDCATCNQIPTKLKLKLPRRGLSRGALKPRGESLDKRVLRTPANNYGGNVENFLLAEYKNAEWLNIDGTNGGLSTGFAKALGNQRLDAAVTGLFGCTSVIVASQAGVWMSHFWEIPSFRATQETWGKARTAPDIANFNEQVINQMQNGGPDIPGLRQFTAVGGQFAANQRPAWVIVTPRDSSGVAGSWKYDPEVTQIKSVLENIFPDVPPIIKDYQPKPSQTDQDETATGKILFQYDPFQNMITDDTNPCNVYQQAMFRIWVEDQPQYVLQKFWAAETNQLITDFSNYNADHVPNRRRDSHPGCQLPSSLIQASTELSGGDMTFSTAPDPDTTYWATLSASSASTTSLDCMADGAPWFSPTRWVTLLDNSEKSLLTSYTNSWCDCGTSSTYPTLSPADGATTANCAYTTVPTAMITPVSTSAAPTNIPGEGGIPGCAIVVYPDGQACGNANCKFPWDF